MKLAKLHQIAIGIFAWVVVLAGRTPVVWAYFTTNILSGVTNNVAGDFIVGYNSYDFLRIDSAGALYSAGGYVGQGLFTPANNNSALVTGVGSVWSNSSSLYVGLQGSGNSLVISNGGQVFSGTGLSYVGYDGGKNNSAVITGTGSVWTCYNELDVGWTAGSNNTLVISNGGQMIDVIGHIGEHSINNNVLVTGPGSIWSSSFALDVGFGSGGTNSLVVRDSGTVYAPRISVDRACSLTLDGGILIASTNSGGVQVGGILNGGTLKGTGTIYARLTLNGTLSPGAITNVGSLTLQSSAVLDYKLGGTGQGDEYGFVLVTNGVVTLNGLLQIGFANGFETNVLNSDTFTLLAADTLTDSFTNVLSGQRLMTTDGDGSFLVSYGDNNLVLSDFQVIPEPSTFVLLIFGSGCLRLLRRRSR